MQPITFQTEKFAPYLPDDCQVNPNVLGFELAAWLSMELMNLGIVTSYPIAEDWGWLLGFKIANCKHLICCYGEKLAPRTFEWRIEIESSKKLFQRSCDHETELQDLHSKIVTCLHKVEVTPTLSEI